MSIKCSNYSNLIPISKKTKTITVENFQPRIFVFCFNLKQVIANRKYRLKRYSFGLIRCLYKEVLRNKQSNISKKRIRKVEEKSKDFGTSTEDIEQTIEKATKSYGKKIILKNFTKFIEQKNNRSQRKILFTEWYRILISIQKQKIENINLENEYQKKSIIITEESFEDLRPIEKKNTKMKKTKKPLLLNRKQIPEKNEEDDKAILEKSTLATSIGAQSEIKSLEKKVFYFYKKFKSVIKKILLKNKIIGIVAIQDYFGSRVDKTFKIKFSNLF